MFTINPLYSKWWRNPGYIAQFLSCKTVAYYFIILTTMCRETNWSTWLICTKDTDKGCMLTEEKIYISAIQTKKVKQNYSYKQAVSKPYISRMGYCTISLWRFRNFWQPGVSYFLLTFISCHVIKVNKQILLLKISISWLYIFYIIQ